MNSAKKLAKSEGMGQENSVKGTGILANLNKNMVLAILGIAAIVVLCAGVCFMQLRPRAVLKVTGTNANGASTTNTVYIKESTYDIYQVEMQYNMYSQLYQQMYGKTYWEMEDVDDAGRTGAGAAKKQVMDGMKQREILFMEAQKLGYTLTDEEKKAAAEELKTAMANFTDAQKKLPGMDQKTLTKVFEKNALAGKYRQVIITEAGIDTEALKATVNKDDYHQYTLQYYMISNKNGVDENAEAVSEETKNANLKNMEALKEKAKTAEDFSKLLDEKDTTGIQAMQTQKLIANEMKDSTFLTEKLRKKLIKMDNGEISDVIETEDGYYLVRMENNDDSEAYDTQCESVVTEKETEAFNAKYQELSLSYTTEIQSYWKGRVKLGSYTTAE